MKIRSIHLTDHSPIKCFKVEDLGNTVIIAGANGSGKTRLKNAIITAVRGGANMDMVIESTRPEEEVEQYFNGKFIEIKKGITNPILKNYINSRTYGSSRYIGSLVQIDSSRSVQTVKYNNPVNWLGGDPDDEESVGNYYFNSFTDRWQQFITYIFQKSAARDKKIAEAMKQSPDKNGTEILQKHPDPFEKYQIIFKKTFPGKELLSIDIARPREFQYKTEDGVTLPFNALSSGEQEVIKILFDVARKDIKHSIIIVDEPELHLHPTLTFQLIEALKGIGEHTNQYIFLTHSSDLISTYYSTGDVYFVDTDQSGENQAHRLSDLVNEHQELVPIIGQNLGLFAVGKKLVFVEGEEASIDRLTYQKIAQSVDEEIRILPVGSVLNIMTLNTLEQQIRQAVFGIELYMIRDRDGLNQDQIDLLEKNGRIRCLKRRHIENYFLDPNILYKVAEKLYITSKVVDLTPESIEVAVKKIAENSLQFNVYQNTKEYLALNYFLKMPVVRDIHSKGNEEVLAELVSSVNANVTEFNEDLGRDKVRAWFKAETNRLETSLESGDWIENFQGKYIFQLLCTNVLKDDPVKIRHAYVDVALSDYPESVGDISNLFKGM